MGNIILFIITLTIISLTLYFIYKSTEKSNSLVEKIRLFCTFINEV